MDETYVFNGRIYRLSAAEGGWLITTGRPGETPVRRQFSVEQAAWAAWSRMLAATVVNCPARLRSAQIGHTFLVLAADGHRAHLGELDGPGGDAVAAYTDRVAAMVAWRDRCCELAFAAAATADQKYTEMR